MTVTAKQLQNLKGPLSPERRALLGSCVADGWSYNQIYLTHRITRLTVKRYYPDYQGMSLVEGAKLGYLAMKSTHVFKNVNHA